MHTFLKLIFHSFYLAKLNTANKMIKNHIFILNNKMGYLCYHLIPLFILFIIFTLFLFPQNSYSSEQIDSTGHKEEFNAGKMIIEHITDAYSWHIVTIGSHHITLHLPIIIYDKGELIIFSSSEFEHNKEYKGYKIETHGMFKGKIVRVSPLPSASSELNRETSAYKVSLPLDLSIPKSFVYLF
ncbi:MAG: hypothetical protein KA792_08730 [Bacteroidales bacterium]|nr:hypothetical protein [Bacteroidales bacterium]